MFRKTYNRFFPTPHFLEMPSFGFDICDESLKFIELIFRKDGIRVGKYGEQKLPPGIVEDGRIKDPLRLEEIILSLKREHKIRHVRVSILENQIYLFRLKINKEGLSSVRSAIELSLEEHIPIPAQEAIFDYDIVDDRKGELDIQVAAIPKNVIDDYLMVFKDCKISVHSFELEPQAIARAVIKRGDMDTYMIVDFGETRTGIFIISKGVVMFTSTLDIGGVVLHEMIQKNFKVDAKEAENIKKKYGLQRSPENKEIFSVLLNSVSILRDEVLKHFLYWHTREYEDGSKNPAIKKIILCGGDSNLTGLADYLSVSIKVKVEMANVWENILDTEECIPELGFKSALSYASALGLALGDFEYD